jgi:hypothetical protein
MRDLADSLECFHDILSCFLRSGLRRQSFSPSKDASGTSCSAQETSEIWFISMQRNQQAGLRWLQPNPEIRFTSTEWRDLSAGTSLLRIGPTDNSFAIQCF